MSSKIGLTKQMLQTSISVDSKNHKTGSQNSSFVVPFIVSFMINNLRILKIIKKLSEFLEDKTFKMTKRKEHDFS